MTSEQNDQILQAIKELHDQMNVGFAKIDKRFEEVDKRFEKIDKRFEEVDRKFEEVDKRFDAMDEKMNKLQAGMDIIARKNFENETEIYRVKKAIGQQ
ncbi:hypothetical protein GCM10007063_12280 [Lentibacillus kapialis]|uniref:t-SNARE coiled-coil homology domain-containing protein n=1 Tax=Lentibacillus kapialis TaxID=340214 RepID=A0A917UWU2_9BACI|nr:hypothetical protein [Lentibacillus kapialis]GGJ91222.1 hypothetical protein GCM10007063_12280 [Lentibacillus kapialis]